MYPTIRLPITTASMLLFHINEHTKPNTIDPKHQTKSCRVSSAAAPTARRYNHSKTSKQIKEIISSNYPAKEARFMELHGFLTIQRAN